MKKARFTTGQIIAILQESAAGAAPAEMMSRHNVFRQTFYAWKGKLKVQVDSGNWDSGRAVGLGRK